MQDALKAGEVDPRSTLGGKFRDHLKQHPKGAENYGGLNRDDAKQYRLEWLKKTYKQWEEQRTYEKAWRRIDTDKGEYMSASQLVIDDGGWKGPEALK